MTMEVFGASCTAVALQEAKKGPVAALLKLFAIAESSSKYIV